MSEELKPCPFCGVVPDIREEPNAWYDGDSAFYAMCMNDDCCMCVETEAYLTREEVTKAWNTRAERTCHNTAPYVGFGKRSRGVFHCSECSRWEEMTGYPFKYCPHCGAKVVE